MVQLNQARGVATSVIGRVGTMEVIYHGTVVVSFSDDKIVLDTGGWKTATTKLRMNQTSNQFGLGYSVFARNREWVVNYRGQDIEFSGNSLVLDR